MTRRTSGLAAAAGVLIVAGLAGFTLLPAEDPSLAGDSVDRAHQADVVSCRQLRLDLAKAHPGPVLEEISAAAEEGFDHFDDYLNYDAAERTLNTLHRTAAAASGPAISQELYDDLLAVARSSADLREAALGGVFDQQDLLSNKIPAVWKSLRDVEGYCVDVDSSNP